jgi:GTP-binding protein
MNIAAFKRKMSESWDALPLMFKSSSEDKLGRDEILDFIEATNKQLSE